MTGVQQGERTFPIGDGNVKLSRGVRLVRAIPSEARFEFERRRGRAWCDVLPRFDGEGTNGYQVAHFTVEPKQLQMVGPGQPRGADRVGGDGPRRRVGGGGRLGVSRECVRGGPVRAFRGLAAGDRHGNDEEEIGYGGMQLGKQLFGTDGIRGVAGEYPLDPATVYAFGVALGRDVTATAEPGRRF